MASGMRLNEVLDTQPSLTDEGSSTQQEKAKADRVAFEDVSFTYAGLMVASFSRIIRELSITYEKITAMADKLYEFLLSGRTRYTEIAKEAGIKADNIRSIDDIEEYEQGW